MSDRLLTLMICLILIATGLAPAAAQDYPEDLLFKASFDRLTAFADYSKGAPESSLDVSLELRAKPGIRSHCLLVEEGEKCIYEAEGNVDVAAGTVSLWVKPANWIGEDKRYVSFFNLYGRMADNPEKGFNLGIDKSDGPETVRCTLQFGSRARDADYRLYLTIGSAQWDSETWHKLDVTWNSTLLAIYVDGKLSNTQDLPNVQFPELVQSGLELGRRYGKTSSVRDDRDLTYIDEVEIYSGAQSADRIMERYLIDRPDAGEELPVPVVSVPKVPAVAVDGTLDDAAWQSASRVPIMTNIRTGLPQELRARASICHDDKTLYVGLWSMTHGDELASNAAQRDEPVFKDDAFEVLLSAGEEPTPVFYQFIVNSRGVLFDALASRKEWNAENVVVRAEAGADYWTAEIAIPFAEIGAQPPAEGDVWRANFCRDWFRPDPQDPIYTTWAYGGPSYLTRPERFGKIVFGGEGAQMSVASGLATGAVSVTASGPQGSQLEVAVTSDGRDALRETVAIDGEATITGSVRDVALADLLIRVTGATGAALNEYSTRVLVKRPIAVTYLPDVPGKTLGLALDLSNLPEEWKALAAAGGTTLDIAAAGPGGDTGTVQVSLDGLAATAAVPCAFAEGNYELSFVLRAPGRADALTVTDALAVPDLSWVGSGVGVSDDVLAPWTPLEYTGDRTVSCWGREYEFAGPLPARVTNQGREILREPVTLTLATDAGEATLAEVSRQCDRSDPNRAEFSGAATFGELADVQWSNWMEYDGMTWASITINPPEGGMNVQSLTMRIPVRDDLRHIRGARKSPNRQEWDYQRWESAFEPFLWLVSEDEGFLYMCESEANWVYERGQPVTVVTGGDEAMIELRIISQPVAVNEPITYEFGFEATPVKPLMDGWREMNFGGGMPIEHQTHQPWMNGYAYYEGTWTTERPEVLRGFDQERHDQDVIAFYYATTSCTPNSNPPYTLFRALWNNPYPAQFGPYGGKGSRFRPDSPIFHLVPVCPADPTFVDYMLWSARNLNETAGVMGFYTDTDGIWPCENAHHGHGFTDAFGKTGVTWTLLGKRDFSKRMATMVRELQRDGDRGYWMTHCHSKLVPPVHCFADFFWPGEEYTHRLYGDKWFYMDTMDELDYRVQLTNNTSGLVHVLLPEFQRGTKDPTDIEHPQPTESLLAMCAVNDVNTSGSYMHKPTMSAWWGLRGRLGLNEAQFTAYWREDCPVKVAGDALASLYLWPDRAAVAIANTSPDEAQVTVEVNLDALGLGQDLQAVDERTGAQLPVQDECFTATVPGRSYTFVSLK